MVKFTVRGRLFYVYIRRCVANSRKCVARHSSCYTNAQFYSVTIYYTRFSINEAVRSTAELSKSTYYAK